MRLVWGAGMLILATATPYAAEVSIPTSLKAGTAADVVVPIVVDPAIGVETMSLAFSYDAGVLVPSGAYLTAATDGFTLAADFATPGSAVLELSGTVPLSTAGPEEVVWVVFEVIGPDGSTPDLVWTTAELNGGAIETTTSDGRVNVVAAPTVIEMPDGVQGIAGGSLMIPIQTNDATGAESFDLIARFNPNVIVPTNVSKTSLTQSMSLNFFLGIPGEARISLFAIHAISGGGPIVQIDFDLVGEFGDRTPLDVSRATANEGVLPTTIDDGLIELCDPSDPDNDGFSGCAGDCDNGNPDVNPGEIEICDGVDNDCDGNSDNAVAPVDLAALGLGRDENGETLLGWSPVIDADGYDVVRGDIGPLVGSGGDFASAVELCLADDHAATSLVDPDIPALGSAVWYAVRATNCGGAASYDSGGPQQFASRDPGIDASPEACP